MKVILFVLSYVGTQLLVGVSGTVNWDDCGTTVVVTDLRITGCTKMPCIFYKGKEYRLEFDAIPTVSSKTLPYTVKAKFIFPWTLLDGDACDELSNGSCPLLLGGKPFTFFKDFSIDIPFPTPSTLPTTITAQMNDDGGNKLLCAKLDILIKNASQDPNPSPSEVPSTSEKPSFVQGFFNFFRS